MARRKCLKQATARDIQKAMARINNELYNGDIDQKTAAVLGANMNVILGSIRTDEQEKKINEFQEAIEVLKARYPHDDYIQQL